MVSILLTETTILFRRGLLVALSMVLAVKEICDEFVETSFRSAKQFIGLASFDGLQNVMTLFLVIEKTAWEE